MAHHFKDEWALRALKTLPALTQEKIDSYRQKGLTSVCQAAMQSGTLTETEVNEAIKKVLKLEPAHVDIAALDKAALSLVPEKICQKYRLIPFEVKGDHIKVAMENPMDMDALADIQAVSGRSPQAFFCFPDKIDELFGATKEGETVVYELIESIDETDAVQVLQEIVHPDNDFIPGSIQSPVIRLVDAVIAKAVKMRASDIHIEHDAKASMVRYRIDGVLTNVLTLPHKLAQGPVIARIKIMGSLDISIHSRPQDGRAKVRIRDNDVGLRISTLPTNFGEKAVIRILDKKAAEVPLEALGITPKIADRLKELLKKEQGIFLVTGPTGSGKTTTLYSMLNKLKSDDINIVTIEDPIEYKLEWINQVQVNEKQGLTFPAVLRSVLRQDPDIIMVGEIRDKETADVAFQAALTGHLVFTTLHTNDSLATVSRLLDMGVERFKIAPGLVAITAQRLARRLCKCKTPAEIPAKLKKAYDDNGLPSVLFRAVGCEDCSGHGFKGRFSLVELFEVTQEMRDLIRDDTEEKKLKEAALKTGALHTLTADVLWHLSQGETSLEEVSGFLEIRTDPVPDKPQEARVTAAIKPVPAEKTGPSRILLTDDDARTRLLMRKLLEVQGYTVEECENGTQALERVVQNKPDLLILDYMMPELNGKEVVKTLKESLHMTDLPIIMLTANTGDEEQEELIRLGADDYIHKPIKPPLVLARVNALFRRLKYKE